MINVVIVGAGRGGSRLIEALVHHPDVHILYVIDPNAHAKGIHLARQWGIPTHAEYEVVLRDLSESVNVILEVTGDTAVYADLSARAPAGATVISGTALQFLVTLMDEQLHSVRETAERQREMELALNAAHDGMIGINRDGVVTLYNAAAARLTGVPVDAALGHLAKDVIPNTRLLHVLHTGESELNRLQRLRDIEIVSNRVPVYDEDGQIIGAIAVFRDVTELSQLASEVTNLREIQTLLQAIIQSTQDAISVVDKDGHGLLINPAYTRLTGLTPEQVIGKPADVDIAEGDSMHIRVLRTKQPVRNVPLKVGPLRREVIVDVAPILVGGELRGSVGVIHDVSEIKRLTEELDRAKQLLRSAQTKYSFEDIVGRSSAMVLAIEQAKRAAQTPATVLLRGESGTGKELFAHAIHHESERRYQPFVRVNCAALSETLLESELFGYEEGAFTGAKRGGKRGLFEEASGGTLFLDEIGEMSLSTQAKLLRALQEQEIVRVGGTQPISVNVRVIAATHVNLEQGIAKGTFREDLYYRLNVIPITIPPLRYRKEDIGGLVEHIVSRHNLAYGRNVARIDPGVIPLLQEYTWPGNVRELENTIARAMIHMAYNETVMEAHHIPLLHAGAPTGKDPEERLDSVQWMTLQEAVQSAERSTILRALKATRGNKTEAARRLGVSIRTLYYKMEQLEIREP